jgi:hypothetical protein
MSGASIRARATISVGIVVDTLTIGFGVVDLVECVGRYLAGVMK